MGMDSVFRVSLVLDMVDNMTSKVQGAADGVPSAVQKMNDAFGTMQKAGVAMTGMGTAIIGACNLIREVRDKKESTSKDGIRMTTIFFPARHLDGSRKLDGSRTLSGAIGRIEVHYLRHTQKEDRPGDTQRGKDRHSRPDRTGNGGRRWKRECKNTSWIRNEADHRGHPKSIHSIREGGRRLL